jgi:hypothetical protein
MIDIPVSAMLLTVDDGFTTDAITHKIDSNNVQANENKN